MLMTARDDGPQGAPAEAGVPNLRRSERPDYALERVLRGEVGLRASLQVFRSGTMSSLGAFEVVWLPGCLVHALAVEHLRRIAVGASRGLHRITSVEPSLLCSLEVFVAQHASVIAPDLEVALLG